MKSLNIFFPRRTEKQIKLMSDNDVKDMSKELPILNREALELQDTLFPVDETTGVRSNQLDKLLSSSVTPLEKERILATLQRMPASKRHNLSDEELINLLPSRYNLTLTDADVVRDFYEETILSDLNSDESSQGDGSSEEQTN